MIFFFQAEDGIRDKLVTGVQTCALPILALTTVAGVRARRICTARWPRPPAPITTAVDPGPRRWSDRLTAWYGVSPASVRGAASTGSRSPIGTSQRGFGTSR